MNIIHRLIFSTDPIQRWNFHHYQFSKSHMADIKLQKLKLELGAIALEHNIDYDQMIKYLSGFQLRPKNLRAQSIPIFQSQHQMENRQQKRSKDYVCLSFKHGDQKENSNLKSLCQIKDESPHQNSALNLINQNYDLVHQTLEDSLMNINKISQTILQNILDVVVTGKLYKIRQNFRDLVLNILGFSNISMFAHHQSGRIQFQDFSSNYITEILESEYQAKELEKLTSQTEDFKLVDMVNNDDFMRVFELNPCRIDKGCYYGCSLKWISDEQETLMACMMIETSQQMEVHEMTETINSKLIKKIIEISLMETSEFSTSQNCKKYTKRMLDLLEILISLCQTKLKQIICSQFELKTSNCYSLSNLIKIILNLLNEDNHQLMNSLKSLSEKFEDTQYKMIEQIRMYKKYANEKNLILLEFNKQGKMIFCSCHRNNPILNELSEVWEPEKLVLFKLFDSNGKLQNGYKKALKGQFSDKFIQIMQGIKAKIIGRHTKIDQIQIIIEDHESQTLSYTASKESETKKKNKKRKIQSVYESETIKHIEEQHPGVINEGWIDLFMKNNRQKKQRSNSLGKKKNNTYLESDEKSVKVFSGRPRSLTQNMDLSDFQSELDESKFDDPDLNVLQISQNDLESFAYRLLNRVPYFRNLSKEKMKVLNFLDELHENYEIHSNPFHNFTHGVNVMHTCYLLANLPENQAILTPKQMFAIVFSGLCHDVGHTGFTNAFEIASKSRKALLYNDKSPLENFHASTTFELLRRQENNFLETLSPEEFKDFRSNVIQNILYTDIKEHFPLIKKFEAAIKEKNILTTDNVSLLSCMIVHSSDFGGSIKDFLICKEWSFRVNQEFSNQYQKEGELGLAQTPFMKDLDNLRVMSKGQCGFLKVIVLPLYQALKKFYLTSDMIHKFNKNLENNIKEWEAIHIAKTTEQEAEKRKESLNSQ